MNYKILSISFLFSFVIVFFLYGFNNVSYEELIKNDFEENLIPKKTDLSINLSDYELIEYKSGKKFNLGSLKGSVFILNFYEPWCPACNKEFYALNEFARKYKGKVKVLSISSGDDMEMLNEWYSKWKYEYIEFYLDKDNKLTELFKVRSIPATYVIDKNQRAIYEFIGDRRYNSLNFSNYIDILLK